MIDVNTHVVKKDDPNGIVGTVKQLLSDDKYIVAFPEGVQEMIEGKDLRIA